MIRKISELIAEYNFPSGLDEIKKLVVDNADITELLVWGGYAVSRNDIDGRNAGMTDDGVTHRDFLRYRFKVELKFRPLTAREWYYVEHEILRGKVWHDVLFNDFGVERLEKMYQSAFAGTMTDVRPGMRIGTQINFIGR